MPIEALERFHKREQSIKRDTEITENNGYEKETSEVATYQKTWHIFKRAWMLHGTSTPAPKKAPNKHATVRKVASARGGSWSSLDRILDDLNAGAAAPMPFQ